MKILVSACLLGDKCKYNGGDNFNEKVVEFVKNNEIVKVCPEVLGGLSIPRIPCEIKSGQVMTKDGTLCTAQFHQGAQKALKMALEKNIDFAILKSRSPSCGKDKIYDGTFSGTLVKGNGIFAELLMQNGIKIFSEEEIDGIQN